MNCCPKKLLLVQNQQKFIFLFIKNMEFYTDKVKSGSLKIKFQTLEYLFAENTKVAKS